VDNHAKTINAKARADAAVKRQREQERRLEALTRRILLLEAENLAFRDLRGTQAGVLIAGIVPVQETLGRSLAVAQEMVTALGKAANLANDVAAVDQTVLGNTLEDLRIEAAAKAIEVESLGVALRDLQTQHDDLLASSRRSADLAKLWDIDGVVGAKQAERLAPMMPKGWTYTSLVELRAKAAQYPEVRKALDLVFSEVWGWAVDGLKRRGYSG